MPFKSKAQQRFMYARHPKIAAQWEDKYGIPKNLPKKIGKGKKKKVPKFLGRISAKGHSSKWF